MSNLKLHWTVYVIRCCIAVGGLAAAILLCISVYNWFTKDQGIDYKEFNDSYLPSNASKAKDIDEIDEVLTCLSGFYDAINENNYEKLLSYIDPKFIELNTITPDSLRKIYTNKYQTEVDFEIVGDMQVGTHIVLWINETNLHLGDEEYRDEDIFNHRTVMSYGLETKKLSLDGFVEYRESEIKYEDESYVVHIQGITVNEDSVVVKLNIQNLREESIDNPFQRTSIVTAKGINIAQIKESPGWTLPLEPGEIRTTSIAYNVNCTDTAKIMKIVIVNHGVVSLPLAE